MLEICVDDIAGLREALTGGAARIELCSALSLGGLTPSAALIAAAVRAPVPVHVLVRPRAGDFLYDGAEAELIAAAGVAGAFSLLPGFTYAVTDGAGETRVLPAAHL
jgi:copper homeostasis protein